MKSQYNVVLENRQTGEPKVIPWESHGTKREVYTLFKDRLIQNTWTIKSVEVA